MSDRDLMEQIAQKQKPKALRKKREAPAPGKTRQQKESAKKTQGEVASFRWPVEFKEALDRFEKKHRVSKKDFVRYATTRLMIAVERGEVEIPTFSEKEQIKIPDVPASLWD